MSRLVCATGLTGSGKSFLSDYFASKGYQYLRFGQTVLDEIIKKGLKPNEETQKDIREKLRNKYGMAGIAKLNYPIIKKLLKKGNVIIDGLYSWSEFKFLKENFGKTMITVAVYSPPEVRYNRLSKRKPGKNDKNLKNHHFTKTEAKKRDYNEIENIEKGGPIVMADYTILNTKDLTYFKKQINALIKEIGKLS